jgi:hypothetical protein
MQQQTNAPEPPAAPPPPGQPTVVMPDGSAITVPGPATTATELRGLRSRREILRDHLERATNRRGQLVSQLDQNIPAEAKVGIQQRLIQLDERILQLEADQAATERAITDAPAQLLGSSSQADASSQGAMGEEEAALLSMGTFAGGVVVALWWTRRRRRRAKPSSAGEGLAAAPPDPRIERLGQAVDAIAEEVERIGEGQRFLTKLLADRRNVMATLDAPRD